MTRHKPKHYSIDSIARLITEDPDVSGSRDEADDEDIKDRTDRLLSAPNDSLISKETIYDVISIIKDLLSKLGGKETPGAILPDVDPNRVLYSDAKPIEYDGPTVILTIDNIEVHDKKAIEDIKTRLEDDSTAGWKFDDFKSRFALMAIFPELVEEIKEKLGLEIRGFGYEKADIAKLYISTPSEEELEEGEEELEGEDEFEIPEGGSDGSLDPQAQADLDILSGMEAPDASLAGPEGAAGPEAAPAEEDDMAGDELLGGDEELPPEEPPPKRQRR